MLKGEELAEIPPDVLEKLKKAIKPHHKFKDHYRIQNLIGLGSLAEVYSCQAILTDHAYAVKIQSNKKLKPDDLLKYHREVKFMKSVFHNSLAKVEHYFKDEDKFYIVMDLCKGNDLFREINLRRDSKKRFTRL